MGIKAMITGLLGRPLAPEWPNHYPVQDPEDETSCEVCGGDVDVILLEGQLTVVHIVAEE